jgi:hypothetical protein
MDEYGRECTGHDYVKIGLGCSVFLSADIVECLGHEMEKFMCILSIRASLRRRTGVCRIVRVMGVQHVIARADRTLSYTSYSFHVNNAVVSTWR